MAKVDEDGYFFIVDRKKDLIIRGGYNVYPREVEEVLYEHPAVQRGGRGRACPTTSSARRSAPPSSLKKGAEADAEELQALRQGAGGGLQVPAQGLVPRRAAEGPDGQDPEARDQGAGKRGLSPVTWSFRVLS